MGAADTPLDHRNLTLAGGRVLLAGEPVGRGDVALLWAAATHQRAIADSARRDVLGITVRVLEQLDAGHQAANLPAALSRLEEPGATLVLAPHPLHLLALTRPYVLGELERDAAIVCVRAGAEIRLPILTSDLKRAHAVAARCNARVGRLLPWQPPFAVERAPLGSGERLRRGRVSTQVVWATELEEAVHDCLEARRHIAETLKAAA